MNARLAAFLALLAWHKDGIYLSDTLQRIRQKESISPLEIDLAREIAYGVMQRSLTLEYITKELSQNKKIRLKPKEKILLHIALYQALFLKKIPLYAIVNEAVQLAKKQCHSSFAGFVNALLRKVADKLPRLPSGDSLHSLSMQYSYPEYFISLLIKDYGLEKTKEILFAENLPGKTMVRFRPGAKENPSLHIIQSKPCKMAILTDNRAMDQIVHSNEYYIQNSTPAYLLGHFSSSIPQPKKILDLCSSPGGKLILAHDIFPKAELFANDISAAKLQRLEENFKKYGIQATLSCYRGEEFHSNELFDLIILDVPCSNTGVLNKRPEARWRISPHSLEEQKSLQSKLLAHGINFLKSAGEIWYLTCSILKNENELLIEKAAKELNLEIVEMKTILPNEEGQDGGFGARLRKILKGT